MPEQQNIEYKSSWHDDHLKWVCGFANGQGGHIYIGKDDDGNVVGLNNYKRLMDEIPNKIDDILGIAVEVNLLEEDGKRYIEIVVPPYSAPISLRGRYYYRSGSVKKELTGIALNEFMLKRFGLTWDDVVEPRATFDDIDEASVRAYAAMSKEKGRLPDIEGLTMEELFDKLGLVKDGQLKRAAIILFGKDPKQFYISAYVKIGRFSKDSTDLKYQDVEEGNIIMLLREVLMRLNQKYLIRPVTFEGMYRIEKGEYPDSALREMLLNSLIHRNYLGSFIHIWVYDDRICIWNDGGLPEGITLESLWYNHSSKPRNKLIAEVCFKGGLIDAWGRGTTKIIDSCRAEGLPDPELTERDGGFLVTLFKNQFSDENLRKMGLNERQIRAVLYVKENGRITNREYQELNGVAGRTALRDLDELTSMNIFKRHGDGKNTQYYI